MPKVAIIGAGIAGLAAAIALALDDVPVEVVDTLGAPGGKMRAVEAGGRAIDAGPTVLTMKWVFDELLAPSGNRLDDLVRLELADVLARHFWSDGSRLDLHADIETSANAIEKFAGKANADGYRRFCRDSAKIFALVREPLICAQRPTLPGFALAAMRRSPLAALRLKAFSTLWAALGAYFPDPRLRQLFGRYATYVGSSPFRAPATLMLVAHVEQDGLWLVDGGMHGVAAALGQFAETLGVQFRYGCTATALRSGGPRGQRIELASGETVDADAVIYNGDVSALGGLLPDAKFAVPDHVKTHERSLSAMTWCAKMDIVDADLAHHNVFFSKDYRAEFDALADGRLPIDDPTVYVCAQDRTDTGRPVAPAGSERLFILVNAPANGDSNPVAQSEVERCLTILTERLNVNGVRMRWNKADIRFTGPTELAKLFPGTGGALYGRASHGSLATFRRPGARTEIAGLYLAGGSVHPGPGVPMAAMSGRLAAASLIEDFGLATNRRSMRQWDRAATAGGMSTV